MQDLKISLVQCRQFWEDKSQNLAHFDALLQQVETTDLILLPEMFQTGFSMNAQQLAENTENSSALNWLKEKAKEKNAAFYTSFIAEDKGKFYNRGVFVYPNGESVFYDKRKLFTLAKEDENFTAGENQVIISYKNWNINLQICYDLRFPEISRNKLNEQNVSDYDLCLYVANWPERRAPHWKALLLARAIENQCFVVGLNRIGTDVHDLSYSGDSMVYSPLGEKLVGDFPSEEKIISCTLSKTNIEEIRQKLNFLKDI
jgi:predicted amidohydrolase